MREYLAVSERSKIRHGPGEIGCETNEVLSDGFLVVLSGLVELRVDDGLSTFGERELDEAFEIVRRNLDELGSDLDASE